MNLFDYLMLSILNNKILFSFFGLMAMTGTVFEISDMIRANK